MMVSVDYQTGPATCPKCGGSDQVRTARELLDSMGGVRDQAFQRLSQFRSATGSGSTPGGPGPTPGGSAPAPGGSAPAADDSGQGAFGPPPPAPSEWSGSTPGSAGDGDYDPYNVEGSDRVIRRNQAIRRGLDFDSGSDGIADDIGGAVFGAALGFAGRTIGRRMKKAFEEKVMPAVEARAAQAQQQWEQSKAEHDAIVERYPELRCCLADQVIFVEGGYQTIPVSELKAPVTLAQADAVVARLR